MECESDGCCLSRGVVTRIESRHGTVTLFEYRHGFVRGERKRDFLKRRRERERKLMRGILSFNEKIKGKGSSRNEDI